MNLIFLRKVIHPFLLAIFDLSAGISNDTVNFLSSTIDSNMQFIIGYD